VIAQVDRIVADIAPSVALCQKGNKRHVGHFRLAERSQGTRYAQGVGASIISSRDAPTLPCSSRLRCNTPSEPTSLTSATASCNSVLLLLFRCLQSHLDLFLFIYSFLATAITPQALLRQHVAHEAHLNTFLARTVTNPSLAALDLGLDERLQTP